MKYLIISLLIFSSFLGETQNVELMWAKTIVDTVPTNNRDYVVYDLLQYSSPAISNQKIRTDKFGNTYISGNFIGVCDFDPGPGVYNMTSTKNSIYNRYNWSTFLLKLDSKGKFVWVKNPVTNQSLRSISDKYELLELDTLGNIYLFSDDKNGAVKKLSKFDPSGKLVWQRLFRSGNILRHEGEMTIDNAGNIIITGSCTDLSLFANSSKWVSIIPNAGNPYQLFIIKLDNSGNYIWGKGIPGAFSKGLINDKKDNFFITGYFEGSVDFDPGSAVTKVTSTTKHAVVLKFDSKGSFNWVRTFSGSGKSYGLSLDVDNLGDVIFTGVFLGEIDVFPGQGSLIKKSTNLRSDFFIEKIKGDGTFLWAHTFGGDYYDYSKSIRVDKRNNIYTTGHFWNKVDFDPSNNKKELTSKFKEDAFLHKMDPNGNLIWVKTFGDLGQTFPTSLYINNEFEIFLTGTFNQNPDFDPDTSIIKLKAVGNHSGFAMKLRQCDTTPTVDKITTCDSLKWIDGKTYTNSNHFARHTLSNVIGCDSIIELELNLGKSNSFTHNVTGCDIYTWINGLQYSSSNNTDTYTLTNSMGCDSVVHLNLDLKHSVFTEDSIIQCDSLTWVNGITYTENNYSATHALNNIYGCDSIVTLKLTLNNRGTEIVNACDSLTWYDGKTYTQSNSSAKWTFKNSFGCDSVVTLKLSINNKGKNIVKACDEYKWIDGKSYDSSNNSARHLLTNSFGCDSIVSLDLTIKKSSQITQSVLACDSYLWIDNQTYYSDNNTATHTLINSVGCDSIVKLDLKVNKSSIETVDNIHACFKYKWINGKTYYNSNFEDTHPLINSTGCDSVVKLNLFLRKSNPKVVVFPNPNKGIMNIDISNLENVKFRMYTIEGKLVYKDDISESNYRLITNIDAGIYIIEVDTECETQRIRVIKN